MTFDEIAAAEAKLEGPNASSVQKVETRLENDGKPSRLAERVRAELERRRAQKTPTPDGE